MINRKFLHLFFKVVVGILFLNTQVSIPRFLRKNFHSFSSNFLFLNQLSSILGNQVDSSMKDFVKTSFTSPISTSIPSYALVKYFFSSFSCSSNFSLNSSHYACCSHFLACGYPSRNLTPFGSDLTTTPMLKNLSP